MPLADGVKELAIRGALAAFMASPDAHVFSRPREIISKQHFIANTAKTILGKTEIRYVEFGFVGFTDVLDEAQFDDDCVPVRLNYRGQVGFSYVEKRSDNSNSYDSVVAYILDLRNKFLDNADIIISGKRYMVSRLSEMPGQDLRIEPHPITEFETHLWDFSFYVGVHE